MSDQEYGVPVDAIRVGAGQFLLAAERVDVDLVFATGGQTFRVISPPVDVGKGRYLATVDLVDGPGAGGQLTVQLQVSHRAGGADGGSSA